MADNPALTVRAFTEADRPAGHAMRVMAFSAKATVTYSPDEDPYVEDRRRFGAFTSDGLLVAHAAAWSFGQWFGGRRVPMAGIGGVTTRPEHRGTGVARPVLRALIEQCLEDGDALSTLYPSLPGFYASLGWAMAGLHTKRRVRTEALSRLPRPDRDVTIRPLDTDDPDDVAAAKGVVDRTNTLGHGTLDRGADFHWRLVSPDDDFMTYVATDADTGRVTGLLAMYKTPHEPQDGHRSFRLEVADLVADDHDSWLAMWRLVASHAPICEWTTFESRPHEPLFDALPVGAIHPEVEVLPWQTRILDVAGAIAARGWPTGVDATVPIVLRDTWLERNDGPWTLHLADGTGRLEPGHDGSEAAADAAVHLNIGTLAALYTGYASPTNLAWQGRLTGPTRNGTQRRAADPDHLAALTAAFRSPTPWLDAYF